MSPFNWKVTWNYIDSPIKRNLFYPLKSAFDLDLNLLISPAIEELKPCKNNGLKNTTLKCIVVSRLRSMMKNISKVDLSI